MNALPCAARPALYDIVLFEEDVPAEARTAARITAAGLCATCPQPCDGRVTTATQPRALTLLPDDYMPPTAEGRSAPEVPQFGGPRRREPQMAIGWDYVRPHQRVAAWTRMAGQMAAAGRSVHEIAAGLAVDEATAARLIEVAASSERGVA
ncbi:hypothetical protein [Streptomyces sp. NPDC048551]|uniref:hypothetical protein n=1 Tax=Streptomyces sp. NPDC048551 TaxID=3155758 RepID=UPI0034399366